MRKFIIAGICMYFGLLSASQGQEVRVAASLEKDTILLGDQIHFTLLVEQAANLPVAFPMLTDTLARGVEIIQAYPADTVENSDGRLRIQKDYTISAFDSGRYEIQPFAFQYDVGDGWKQSFTDYLYLTVMRVDISPADTSRQYFDIKAPYTAPVTFMEVLPWGLLGIALLALVWFLYRYFKARKEGKSLVWKETPEEPAHVLAFRQLEKLKEQKLWQQDQLKAYYTGITAVLRQYIFRQYGVQSPEQTSSETLELLKEGAFIPEELWQALSDILLSADLVKFAKARPNPSDHVEIWDRAWHFVEKTYPRVSSEKGKEEGGEA